MRAPEIGSNDAPTCLSSDSTSRQWMLPLGGSWKIERINVAWRRLIASSPGVGLHPGQEALHCRLEGCRLLQHAQVRGLLQHHEARARQLVGNRLGHRDR